MSLTTLLFVVTLVIVFSGAEVLKLLITELLQPRPILLEEARPPAPLLLVPVVGAAVPPGAEAAGGASDEATPRAR